VIYFLIIFATLLFPVKSYSQVPAGPNELQNAIDNLLAKKQASCDWLAEVKRTNTWLERDQASRGPIMMLHKDAAERNESPDPAKLNELKAAISAIDKTLQTELDDLVRRCGWPTTTGFGDKAPQYAALIIQHGNVDYQLKYFPVMRAAVTMGELPGRFLGELEDRIRMKQGKPQIYGSQIVAGKTPGELALWQIEDEEHVDERRAKIDMIPASLCAYIGLFRPPVKYARCQ
jgi:hypothetical protein